MDTINKMFVIKPKRRQYYTILIFIALLYCMILKNRYILNRILNVSIKSSQKFVQQLHNQQCVHISSSDLILYIKYKILI